MSANIRVLAGDPGTVNHGLCLAELIGVTSVVMPKSNNPADGCTRVVVPRFLIHQWDTLNLDKDLEIKAASAHATGAESLLPLLRDEFTGQETINRGFMRYRSQLMHQVAADPRWALAFAPYPCAMTGCIELPIVATENQLDVSDANPKDRERQARLNGMRARTRSFLESTDPAHIALQTQLPRDVVDLLHEASDPRKLRYPPRDDFNKARMYTLGQCLAACAETYDAATLADEFGIQRLLINAAKKHTIASDNSMTHAQRKNAAVNLTYQMLREQMTDASLSEEERANGKRWIDFLDKRVGEDGQKLDDMADAFLMAIEIALKAHKKWHKKIAPQRALRLRQPPPEPLACYAPVTAAERATALGLPPRAAAPPRARPRKPTSKRARDEDDEYKEPKGGAVDVSDDEETIEREAPSKQPPRKRRRTTTGESADK